MQHIAYALGVTVGIILAVIIDSVFIYALSCIGEKIVQSLARRFREEEVDPLVKT